MAKRFHLALACGLFALVGCGGDGGVAVEGKVTKDGAPFALANGEKLVVTMTSDDGKSTISGEAQPDGTFRIKSPTGGGVAPGKYKVSYTYYQAAVPGKSGGSPPTRQLAELWEVTPAAKTFTLDIGGKK